MQRKFDYHRAACHEAGHAVGAYLLGVPIGELYVTPGLSAFVPGLSFGEAAERGLLRECAIVSQLGPATEQRLFGKFDAVCCEEDFDVIVNGWLPRIENLGERAALKSELPRLADDLIESPGFLDAVRALTDEVVRVPGVRKELEPTRVVEVIRATLGIH